MVHLGLLVCFFSPVFDSNRDLASVKMFTHHSRSYSGILSLFILVVYYSFQYGPS